MILKWFLGRKEKSHFQNGYDYVIQQYQENPSQETIMRLLAEEEDEFGYRSFNYGMLKALNEIMCKN